MIGSSAPQRALHRLERLDRAAVRLGTVELPAALVGNSLSAFAEAPLDESLLEAVLDRLGERAADARHPVRPAARAAPREPAPLPLRRALPWPADAAPTSPTPDGAAVRSVRPPERASRTAVGRTDAAFAEADGLRPAAGEVVAEAAGGSRSAAVQAHGPLAAAAARVPGGAEAIATPVAANWVHDAEATIVPLPEQGAPTSGVHEAFRRALAAATPPVRRTAHEEPPSRSGARRSALPGAAPVAGRPAPAEPDRDGAERPPSAEEPSLAPTARQSPLREEPPATDRPVREETGMPHRGARPVPVESVRRRGRQRPVDAPVSTPAGAGGLAELVRRWEQGRSLDDDEPDEWFDEPEVPGTPLDPADPADPWDAPDSEPLDPYEGDDVLAAALDRLLAGELRRHGIDPEAA